MLTLIIRLREFSVNACEAMHLWQCAIPEKFISTKWHEMGIFVQITSPFLLDWSAPVRDSLPVTGEATQALKCWSVFNVARVFPMKQEKFCICFPLFYLRCRNSDIGRECSVASCRSDARRTRLQVSSVKSLDGKTEMPAVAQIRLPNFRFIIVVIKKNLWGADIVENVSIAQSMQVCGNHFSTAGGNM